MAPNVSKIIHFILILLLSMCPVFQNHWHTLFDATCQKKEPWVLTSRSSKGLPKFYAWVSRTAWSRASPSFAPRTPSSARQSPSAGCSVVRNMAFLKAVEIPTLYPGTLGRDPRPSCLPWVPEGEPTRPVGPASKFCPLFVRRLLYHHPKESVKRGLDSPAGLIRSFILLFGRCGLEPGNF